MTTGKPLLARKTSHLDNSHNHILITCLLSECLVTDYTYAA